MTKQQDADEPSSSSKPRGNTKSGKPRTRKPQDKGAIAPEEIVVQSASISEPTKETTSMSSEQTTIIDYADDIADVEAPIPLPIGQYPATIVAAEVATSATTNNRYFKVTLSISPNNYPVDYPQDNAPDGKTLVFRRLSAEPNRPAMYRLQQFLKAIGAPLGKRIDASEWVGRECTVDVAHQEYEGMMREDVKSIGASL